MERRLSGSVAVAGLLAALGIFLLGREAPSNDVGVAAADLEAAIRENAAGAQARADTLAQLPRLGWAVATDEDTMRDLTTEELAFRPHPGEHIEITQMRKGGGEPHRLLRLPAESDLALPVLPGTQVVVRAGKLHVVTVVSVEPRQRAEELVGILAVSKQIDTSAIEQRLGARGISAELRTLQGSLTLAGRAPSSPEAKVALTGPAAEGAELVAANIGKARWPGFVAPLILVFSLAAAGILWRRGATNAQPDAIPIAALPTQGPPTADTESTAHPLPPPPPTGRTAPTLPPPTGRMKVPTAPFGRLKVPTPPIGRSTAPTPTAVPTAAEEWASNQLQETPAMMSNPLDIEGAAPEAEWEPAMSGRVEISMVRSGSVSLSSRAPNAHASPAGEADPRAEEYRSLFSEFVNLRRTTGESVEGLDVAHFVEALREKRAQLLQQLPIKDVRFKLAFQNGKAAIRYLTVT